MSEATKSRSWPRSAGAVFAGLLTNIIPAIAVDAGLHAARVYPPMGQNMSDGLLVLASSYRILLAIAGGYITARLAPNRPMKHALVLGCIGVALASTGAIVMWDAGHAWYPLGLIAISVPCSLMGGKLHRNAMVET